MTQRAPRSIVVAVDDSETSKHAFDWAVTNLLNKDTDHLRLIHVQPFHEVTDVIASAEMAVPVYSAGKVREDSLNIARKYAKLCKELAIQNYKEDIILEDGSAGAAICEYVEGMHKDADQLTLVLGSRELGFFGRAFIGSTSEHCVRHCSCPVIVVKLPSKKKA
jgi:nucleotide-binding universal stress UspA family protein